MNCVPDGSRGPKSLWFRPSFHLGTDGDLNAAWPGISAFQADRHGGSWVPYQHAREPSVKSASNAQNRSADRSRFACFGSGTDWPSQLEVWLPAGQNAASIQPIYNHVAFWRVSSEIQIPSQVAVVRILGAKTCDCDTYGIVGQRYGVVWHDFRLRG